MAPYKELHVGPEAPDRRWQPPALVARRVEMDKVPECGCVGKVYDGDDYYEVNVEYGTQYVVEEVR